MRRYLLRVGYCGSRLRLVITTATSSSYYYQYSSSSSSSYYYYYYYYYYQALRHVIYNLTIIKSSSEASRSSLRSRRSSVAVSMAWQRRGCSASTQTPSHNYTSPAALTRVSSCCCCCCCCCCCTHWIKVNRCICGSFRFLLRAGRNFMLVLGLLFNHIHVDFYNLLMIEQVL